MNLGQCKLLCELIYVVCHTWEHDQSYCFHQNQTSKKIANRHFTQEHSTTIIMFTNVEILSHWSVKTLRVSFLRCLTMKGMVMFSRIPSSTTVLITCWLEYRQV